MTPEEIDKWFNTEECDCGCLEIKALAKLGALVRQRLDDEMECVLSKVNDTLFGIHKDSNSGHTLIATGNTPEEALLAALETKE